LAMDSWDGQKGMKILDIVFFRLPRRKLFEKNFLWFDRIEHYTNDILESLLKDYIVSVEIADITFGFDRFGRPRTLIVTIKEKEIP